MTFKDETMNTKTKQALEMSIKFAKEMSILRYDWSMEIINACKEALEQPAQEPLTRAQQVIRANNTAQPAQEPVATIQQFERKWIDKEALEQPAEPRLVSYALDGSTCTLNIDGEEVYFNREQPAQEPVELDEALKHCNGKDCNCYAYYQGECACDADWTPEEVVKLRYQLKNTHPHQWQGLTDDEIGKLFDAVLANDKVSTEFFGIEYGRAIEQALKEKNHD